LVLSSRLILMKTRRALLASRHRSQAGKDLLPDGLTWTTHRAATASGRRLVCTELRCSPPGDVPRRTRNGCPWTRLVTELELP
jgi:hypothetical protein